MASDRNQSRDQRDHDIDETEGRSDSGDTSGLEAELARGPRIR